MKLKTIYLSNRTVCCRISAMSCDILNYVADEI